MAPALNPGMPRKPSPIVFPVLLALALVFGCKDQRYVFAPSGLTLRNAPSAAGQSIGIVPVGSSVEILEESESTATVEGITAPFVRIKFEQTEGWVFSGFLTEDESMVEKGKECKEAGRALFGTECMHPWIARVKGAGFEFRHPCHSHYRLKPDGNVDYFTRNVCGPIHDKYFEPALQSNVGEWSVLTDTIKVRFHAGNGLRSCISESMMSPEDGKAVNELTIHPGGKKILDPDGVQLQACYVGCCS